ncbi:MAG: dTDP-4-dehydrorhamnose reductase [Anaerolineales bacterium]|nr:MAG: dTDP-4-dehydrorhamnose reductase [Anaerolineales bacterium]
MRIVITGSKGQLGSALGRVLDDEELLLVDLPEHDITHLESIVQAITEFRPEVIIHAAAMTDVDGCEREPDMAHLVNVLGTRNVAVAAQQSDSSLVYISTDYVFGGHSKAPYREYDEPNPLSIYARTKWIGEQLARSLLSRYYVVRTAWLYGKGHRNFVEAILGLADQRDSVQMVTDEIGSPTYALDLARALSLLIRQPAYGTYHLSNTGTCSRYGWAKEILRLAGRTDLELVPSENYPRAARVPKHVALCNFFGSELGIVMRPWQEALQDYFDAR